MLASSDALASDTDENCIHQAVNCTRSRVLLAAPPSLSLHASGAVSCVECGMHRVVR